MSRTNTCVRVTHKYAHVPYKHVCTLSRTNTCVHVTYKHVCMCHAQIRVHMSRTNTCAGVYVYTSPMEVHMSRALCAHMSPPRTHVTKHARMSHHAPCTSTMSAYRPRHIMRSTYVGRRGRYLPLLLLVVEVVGGLTQGGLIPTGEHRHIAPWRPCHPGRTLSAPHHTSMGHHTPREPVVAV